jgi:hypothetical protein
MMAAVEKVNPSMVGRKQETVHQIGQLLMERVREGAPVAERYSGFKEAILKKLSKEALTLGNNTALTTTAVASFVEKPLRPDLIAMGVIRTTTLDMKGHTALKIPKSTDVEASAVTNSAVTADDNDYSSTTITPALYGLRTTLNYEVLQQANIDVIADKFGDMGYALAKKADDLIMTEIELASHKNDSTYDASGTNNNYVFSGSATDIDYADLISCWSKAKANNAKPDFLILNPTNAGIFYNDTQIKAMIKASYDGKNIFPIETFLNMRIIVTSQCPDYRTFMVDSTKLGYFVEGGPVAVFDGRIDNTIATELLAVKYMGVGIINPKAVTSIADHQADPGTGTY